MTWAAWSLRNSRLFDEVPISPIHVTTGLVKLVSDYKEYADKVYDVVRNNEASPQNNWKVPTEGFFKINTDAALFGSGEVGLGAVVRDESGVVVGVANTRRRANWDHRVAEAMAIRYGLQVAEKMGLEHVEMESDALTVVSVINRRHNECGLGSFIFTDICLLAACFTCCKFNHVKRGGNTVAHYVARLCSSIDDEILYDSNVPQGITTLAELDLI